MRASRRLWARLMKDRFKAKDPRSMLLRFHTQTAGCSLTAQEPYNNVIRTTTEALAAILGGTQSLHTNSLDEVYMIPSEEAVKIANDSPYGLAAAVWTRDIFKAMRTVKSLRAGIVWVNHMQPTYVEAPWGGYKQSGFGRELGPWGIEEYLETKQVHINLNETPIGWY